MKWLSLKACVSHGSPCVNTPDTSSLRKQGVEGLPTVMVTGDGGSWAPIMFRDRKQRWVLCSVHFSRSLFIPHRVSADGMVLPMLRVILLFI